MGRQPLSDAINRTINALADLPADEPRDRYELLKVARPHEIAYAMLMLSKWRQLWGKR